MSIMRIGGLASGMDIEQIVSDLMSVRRAPLDKLTQQKQRLEWQQEDYRSMNTELNNMREKLFNLKLSSTFSVKTAVSSNTNVAQVTVSGIAVEGTYSLAVTQLAEGAFKTSLAALGSGEDKTTLAAQFGLSGDIAFSINGQQFTVNAETESINSLVQKINNADIGVRASYDTTLDRFFLSTTETGSQAEITITDGADAGGTNLFSGALKIDTTYVQGKDAVFKLNGADFAMASNDFIINGISYSLKGVSQTGTDGQPISTNITVKTDTEQIFNNIMDFIRTYNETISKINSKLSEEYYRDFDPLTDDMREELDDDQIEKWTAKARSGLLRNDSLLTGVVSQLRTDIYSVVEGLSGEYNCLAKIGITTGTYSERGKLYVDEDALRQTIVDDPDGIKELFTATSDDGNAKNEGIAARLYTDVLKGISRVTEKAGVNTDFSLVDNSAIGKRIRNMDDSIDDFEDRLEIIEQRYWKQFTAMEEALNRMNSQSMWLTQQLVMTNQG